MSLFLPNALRTIAMVISALAMAVSAAAQTPPAESSLRLTLAAFGGYDTDVTGIASDPAASPSAPYAGGRASLVYKVRTQKIGFSAHGGADSRHYRTDEPIAATSYDGGGVFAADLTSRLKVSASVTGGYSPRFVFSLLPVVPGEIGPDIVPPPLDYGLSAQRMASYATGANAALRVSRRSTLNVAVSSGGQMLLDDNYDTTSRSYGGGYSYTLTRYTSLRAGYRVQNTNYSSFGMVQGTQLTQRLFDVGVNYSRPLSLSRRTTVSFGTGSGAIDDGRNTFYNIIGNATLLHQIGRTWEASVTYTRGFSIVGGFSEPFFADAVNTMLRGHITNRLTMLTTAGFSNGTVGLGTRPNNYDSFNATSRLEMVLKRERMGVYGDYFFYGYRFDEPPQSVSAIPQRVNRQGVRAGLIFRFPLLHERTPRVTR